MASSRERRFILWFEEIGAGDTAFVGSKNALLGEVIRHLGRRGIRVPQAFAVTTHAYRHLVKEAEVLPELKSVMSGLDPKDPQSVSLKAKQARDLFLRARFPSDLEGEIAKAYRKLCSRTAAGEVPVAVRSSPVVSPAPDAPFGLHDSILNVSGEYAVVDACRRCFASLFSERAVAYHLSRRIDPVSAVLALGVQRMVRSDAACSGRATTVDPRSGFPDAILVQGGYGFSHPRVGQAESLDGFLVHKPTLRKGFRSVVNRHLGMKEWKFVPESDPDHRLMSVPVSRRDRDRYILSDEEVLELARAAVLVETHLGRPVEIAWAKDGDGVVVGSGLVFLLQVRSMPHSPPLAEFPLYLVDPSWESQEVLRGRGVGNAIGHGKIKVISDLGRLNEFTVGSVLVSEDTDQEWERAMRAAAAVITVRGDHHSHAARFCGELGLPCLVGGGSAVARLGDGMDVTVDCREDAGIVTKGRWPFRVERISAAELPGTKAELMLIAGASERTFSEALYPFDGGGTIAVDAIIEEEIGIHPLALLDFDQLGERRDQRLGDEPDLAGLLGVIEKVAGSSLRKADWMVETLACAIGSVAAAAYREVTGKVKGDVLVRFSSLSSDRYLRLLGGDRYEPRMDDPLRDLRGAGRHLDPVYGRAFSLECQAIKRVREEMGLTNVNPIVPLCRTPEEGRRFLSLMEKHGLTRGENGLEIYLQVQNPSNILLVEQFSRLFDGFVVDAEDLVCSVVGLSSIPRDSGLYKESAAAGRRLFEELLHGARRHRPRRRVGVTVADPEMAPSWLAFVAAMGVDFVATRPSRVTIARLVVAYSELAREERKDLVVVEADARTGRETVRIGVPMKWLKDRALRWARHRPGQVWDYPVEARRAAVALLNAMTPVARIERPGKDREVVCWRADEVIVAKEARARGVKSVKVLPVGGLSAQELVEVAHLWSEQTRSDGRKTPTADPAKIRNLVKRYENARAEFISHVFATAVTDLLKRDMGQ